jgi:sigma-B regulation protein RsbU (phosphoserine phosphatase)
LIGKLNRLVHDLTTAGQYVTAFYGILHRLDLRIQFVNAGHLPAFIVRNGEIQSVGDDSDPVIGILPDYVYRTQEVSMKLDETLLLYTDGVTECTNRQGEMYESERLREVLISSAAESLTVLSANLQSSLNAFRQDAEQSDDITYLGLRPHS